MTTEAVSHIVGKVFYTFVFKLTTDNCIYSSVESLDSIIITDSCVLILQVSGIYRVSVAVIVQGAVCLCFTNVCPFCVTVT